MASKPFSTKRVLTTLDRLESHISAVETKIDQQSFNTKPIWERALSEIAEVNRNLSSLNRKLDVFNGDMLTLRADQRENDERLRRLEAEGDGGIVTIQ